MVTILKDIAVDGIDVIPCRINGPRGIVKTFILHDDDSTVLIDSGFNDADSEIIAQRLAKLGRQVSDITLCLLTHYHGDHVGGLAGLRQIGDFPVVCHPADVQKAEEAGKVKIDRTVEDGEVLPEVGGLRILHMPGHSPGSIAIYSQRTGALAVGDAIVSAGEHVIVSPPFLCADKDQAVESVRKLLALGLDVKHLLVAHGDDVYHTASGPLARILDERRVAF
jgi:glyoxylase-like metal-dependent hydrolase (beta-lactamase superfamily II)